MASGRTLQLARCFSTTSSRAVLVKAPIQLFGTEGRYAHALYSAASKQKQLDKVAEEVNSVQALMKKDVKLTEFILNPTIKRTQKKDVLVSALQKLKYSDVTVNLFSAMAENGRLGVANNILNAFGKIMSAHRGEVVCSVTTAKPLDAANMKALEAALNAFLKKGESLHLETKVDPALIGGMVVNIGDRYVDMSMATKINTYTNLIKEAV